MNVLIDTHIALWSMYNDRLLSEKARACLLEENNVIFVSLVSAWEIAIRSSIGKLNVPADEFLKDCGEMGYRELSLKKKHIGGFQKMPPGPEGHQDPFDRMLLAQAESEGIYFLTEDEKILQYNSAAIIRRLYDPKRFC